MRVKRRDILVGASRLPDAVRISDNIGRNIGSRVPESQSAPKPTVFGGPSKTEGGEAGAKGCEAIGAEPGRRSVVHCRPLGRFG